MGWISVRSLWMVVLACWLALAPICSSFARDFGIETCSGPINLKIHSETWLSVLESEGRSCVRGAKDAFMNSEVSQVRLEEIENQISDTNSGAPQGVNERDSLELIRCKASENALREEEIRSSISPLAFTQWILNPSQIQPDDNFYEAQTEACLMRNYNIVVQRCSRRFQYLTDQATKSLKEIAIECNLIPVVASFFSKIAKRDPRIEQKIQFNQNVIELTVPLAEYLKHAKGEVNRLRRLIEWATKLNKNIADRVGLPLKYRCKGSGPCNVKDFQNEALEHSKKLEAHLDEELKNYTKLMEGLFAEAGEPTPSRVPPESPQSKTPGKNIYNTGVTSAGSIDGLPKFDGRRDPDHPGLGKFSGAITEKNPTMREGAVSGPNVNPASTPNPLAVGSQTPSTALAPPASSKPTPTPSIPSPSSGFPVASAQELLPPTSNATPPGVSTIGDTNSRVTATENTTEGVPTEGVTTKEHTLLIPTSSPAFTDLPLGEVPPQLALYNDDVNNGQSTTNNTSNASVASPESIRQSLRERLAAKLQDKGLAPLLDASSGQSLEAKREAAAGAIRRESMNSNEVTFYSRGKSVKGMGLSNAQNDDAIDELMRNMFKDMANGPSKTSDSNFSSPAHDAIRTSREIASVKNVESAPESNIPLHTRVNKRYQEIFLRWNRKPLN